MEKQRIA